MFEQELNGLLCLYRQAIRNEADKAKRRIDARYNFAMQELQWYLMGGKQ